MENKFVYEDMIEEHDPKILAIAEEFRDAKAALEAPDADWDDIAGIEENYFNEIDEYLSDRLPVLIVEGRIDDSWRTVMQAFGQLSDEDFHVFDGNEVHEICLRHMKHVAESVHKPENRSNLLELLCWMEETEEFPSWIRSSASVIVHDSFSEPEFLHRIAEWYKKKYQADPEFSGAFWRGKLKDIAERMGNDPDWLEEAAKMDQADPVIADMVYAECLARRGDERCLDVWNKVEAGIDPESEEQDHLLYSILWGRFDYYSQYGTDEQADEAEDALNEYMEDMGDCCCEDEDDECGCGCGHHHDEEEECGCGHHHDHEDGECKCGGHHDHEEGECRCGHHHDEN